MSVVWRSVERSIWNCSWRFDGEVGPGQYINHFRRKYQSLTCGKSWTETEPSECAGAKEKDFRTMRERKERQNVVAVVVWHWNADTIKVYFVCVRFFFFLLFFFLLFPQLVGSFLVLFSWLTRREEQPKCTPRSNHSMPVGMARYPCRQPKQQYWLGPQGLLTRINGSCSSHKHQHTHTPIHKSLLNLQGTFMQLLFDMLPCSLSFQKIDNDNVNMCSYLWVSLCERKGFQFKWTCRWAFYFLTHSIILLSGHMENCKKIHTQVWAKKKAQRTKWHWNTASNLSYVTFGGWFCEYSRCLFAEFFSTFCSRPEKGVETKTETETESESETEPLSRLVFDPPTRRRLRRRWKEVDL